VSSRQEKSILLESDPIRAWLETPYGYYVGVPFGFNPNIILFKNKQIASISLNRMLDDMARDVGEWIYDVIENVSMGSDNIDDFKIEIRYINGTSLITQLNGEPR